MLLLLLLLRVLETRIWSGISQDGYAMIHQVKVSARSPYAPGFRVVSGFVT